MNDNKALKSGAWYTLSNFFVKSIGFMMTPIFARLLTKEEFGLYNNFVSWLGIFTIVITLYLESTFASARFDFKEDFEGYILSSLVLSSVVCAFSAIFLNVFYFIFQKSLGMNRLYMNVMLLYLLFLPAINMFQAHERYKYEYKKTVLLSLMISISSACLSLALVLLMTNRLSARVYGSLIPVIVIGSYIYYIIYRNGKRIHISYWKYSLKICLPYIPHLLSLNVLNSVDRIMITRIRGAEENAVYSLAYTCGTIITTLVISVNSAFSPWLGEKLNAKEYSNIKKISTKYLLLFWGVAVLIMLLTPEVLMILGGKKYLNAVQILPPIACGCIFQFLYTMCVNIEQFEKKTIGMAFASISAALLNYILNSIFIPLYGNVAAAYTTLAGFAWLLLVHMFLVFKYGFHKVYSYTCFSIVILCSIILMVFIDYLYDHNILRYIILSIYVISLLIMILKNKHKVLVLFKNNQ